MWGSDGKTRKKLTEAQAVKLLLNMSIVLCGLLASSVSAATPDFYAGFRNLPSTVSMYHYKVPDKVLEIQMQTAMQKASQEAQREKANVSKQNRHGSVTVNVPIFVLPQLYIFDKTGREILARTAESNDLDVMLDHAFASPVPLPEGKPLRVWLDALVSDKKFPIAEPRKTGKFTVLEYWASWCEYCFVERDQLLAYFRKHPDLQINWITADADFTSVAGTNPPAPSPH